MLASWFGAAAVPAHAVVFTGEVRAEGAQPLFTPPSDSSPVVLRAYLADGTRVKAGEVLLRTDAGPAAAQIRDLDAKIEQARAKIDKEAAELRLKLADAELALIDARAALDTAQVDAAIPRQLVSALDFDRYHAEFDKTTHDAALKTQEVEAARAAVARRFEDGKLEVDKLVVQKEYNQAQVEAAEVRADRDGTLVHGFSRWLGTRIDEGTSTYPGQEVGTVVSAEGLSVRAWVLEPDRPGLKVGQRLQLGFDALPGLRAGGTIRTISGASEARQEWGPGRYYVVDVDLPDIGAAKLSPGMSVRVSSDGDDAATDVVHASAPQAPHATGEVYTRSTAAISPPQIEDLWQLTVTKMADDGKLVKKGDPIVSFDGGEIVKLLTAKRSELEEKKRTQEKLHLELAEKARTETLTVAEAHAEAIKAQRKASQPEAYVPGVEYKKLVIARRKAEEREAKSVERERIAADERNAEQRAADADVARLSADVARMQASLAQLNLTAPRDGTFLHAVQPWNNVKIEVGKQVWRGVSVGQIPDTATLAVRAALPERDLARVKPGDRVRITLEGGSGQTVPGHIEDIGISVHSKSRVEPVPVIDLNITLDGGSGSLKPGQPVQVDVVGAAARLSAS
jgi:multidrug resistance efflux pump